MVETKVYIYGLCDVFYDSYYIQGIKEIFSEVEFNISKFPDFNQGVFAFVVCEGDKETKVIIDSRDTDEIDFMIFDWCDKYGKVNYNKKILPLDNYNKIVAIGPSFGIKIWNLIETIFYGVIHLFKFKAKIKNKREFLANYWRQFKRRPLSDYTLENSKNNEVFFISSIWKKENVTNSYRASFIQECMKNKRIEFTGGFAPRNDGDNLGYDNMVYSKRISLKDYLSKMKNSAFVFNTPAVLSCHGWKLGEFLALGKAIISTPHRNSMPQQLEDNHHLVYVSSSEDIEKKINVLIDDLDLKKRLENNSRDYFERNLMPKIVIEKLLR